MSDLIQDILTRAARIKKRAEMTTEQLQADMTGGAPQAPGGPPQPVTDPRTGMPTTPDPNTGQPIPVDPNTGNPAQLDPKTGQPIPSDPQQVAPPEAPPQPEQPEQPQSLEELAKTDPVVAAVVEIRDGMQAFMQQVAAVQQDVTVVHKQIAGVLEGLKSLMDSSGLTVPASKMVDQNASAVKDLKQAQAAESAAKDKPKQAAIDDASLTFRDPSPLVDDSDPDADDVTGASAIAPSSTFPESALRLDSPGLKIAGQQMGTVVDRKVSASVGLTAASPRNRAISSALSSRRMGK